MKGNKMDGAMEISDVEVGEEPRKHDVTSVAKRKMPRILFLCVETYNWRVEAICEKWRNFVK
jgi:hypothetical protein